MKRLNYSKRNRWIAMLFAIIFGTASLLGGFTIFFTYEMNLYQKPLDTVISSHYKELQEFYSAKIYNCLISKKTYPKISNLEYGVIKEENLDFTPDDQYICDYFWDTSPLSASAQVVTFSRHHTYTPDSPTLLSGLTSHDISYSTKTNENAVPIKRIDYNIDNGIFYYRTEKYSIPIRKLKVYKSNVEYINDKLKASDYESFTLEDTLISSDETDASYPQYLSDSGNCKPLNTANYTNWQAIYLEDFRIYSGLINVIRTKNLLHVIDDRDVDLISADEFHSDGYRTTYPYIDYSVKSESGGTTYCVVSNVKKTLDMTSDDLFAKQAVALTFLYNMRYIAIVGTLLSAILFCAAVYFLCAGICNAQTLQISLRHKIPFFLYFLIIAVPLAGCSALAVFLLHEACYGNIGTRMALLIELPIIAADFLLLLFFIMNLTTRLHCRVFWKYTVSSHIARIIKNAAHNVYTLFSEHTALMTKGSLIYLVYSLVLLFCFCFIYASAANDKNSLCIPVIWLVLNLLGIPVFFQLLIQAKHLQEGGRRLASGNLNNKIDTSKMFWEFRKHGQYLNQINDGISIALEDRLRSERFKTELITNVSHDIKTPLTSIINYVDLLQKENITDNERQEYLAVLERQSARLKKLIEDLLEASKASTKNLPVTMEECNVDILLTQTAGEFEERLWTNNLELIVQKQETPIWILADSKHLWRIFDNLMSNICKYAQPDTRVYINQKIIDDKLQLIFLNTSKYALNISGDDLMERFVRGDASRNTEGNGLGLSIARSLAELMNATLHIEVEGDLFKAILTFNIGAETRR